MGIVINKCAKCGHEWPQSTAVPPRRCPAEGCRTMRWRLMPEPEMVVRKTVRRGRGKAITTSMRMDK